MCEWIHFRWISSIRIGKKNELQWVGYREGNISIWHSIKQIFHQFSIFYLCFIAFSLIEIKLLNWILLFLTFFLYMNTKFIANFLLYLYKKQTSGLSNSSHTKMTIECHNLYICVFVLCWERSLLNFNAHLMPFTSNSSIQKLI